MTKTAIIPITFGASVLEIKEGAAVKVKSVDTRTGEVCVIGVNSKIHYYIPILIFNTFFK